MRQFNKVFVAVISSVSGPHDVKFIYDRLLDECQYILDQSIMTLSLAGCLIPDYSFRPIGPLLDDGRAPVNGSVVFECSNNRILSSFCSADGEWEPLLICPNLTGKDIILYYLFWNKITDNW